VGDRSRRIPASEGIKTGKGVERRFDDASSPSASLISPGAPRETAGCCWCLFITAHHVVRIDFTPSARERAQSWSPVSAHSPTSWIKSWLGRNNNYSAPAALIIHKWFNCFSRPFWCALKFSRLCFSFLLFYPPVMGMLKVLESGGTHTHTQRAQTWRRASSKMCLGDQILVLVGSASH